MTTTPIVNREMLILLFSPLSCLLQWAYDACGTNVEEAKKLLSSSSSSSSGGGGSGGGLSCSLCGDAVSGPESGARHVTSRHRDRFGESLGSCTSCDFRDAHPRGLVEHFKVIAMVEKTRIISPYIIHAIT